MTTTHVRGHMSQGHSVRPHSRNVRSAKAQLADTGLGVMVGVGSIATEVLNLTAMVVSVLAYTIAALAGLLLGYRFYKRQPSVIRKARARVRRVLRPTRLGSVNLGGKAPAPRPSHPTAPWHGDAPWANNGPRSTSYVIDRVTGELRKVHR